MTKKEIEDTPLHLDTSKQLGGTIKKNPHNLKETPLEYLPYQKPAFVCTFEYFPSEKLFWSMVFQEKNSACILLTLDN